MNIDVEALHRLVQSATQGGGGKVPRIAVSVANREGLLYEDGMGPRIYHGGAPQESGHEDVSPTSIFWLASQTKLITSLAAAQLLDNGTLTLDDDVGIHVPELKDISILKGYSANGKPILAPKGKAITLQMLFTHTAGSTFAMSSEDHERYRIEQGLERPWVGPSGSKDMYTRMPLKYEPGTAFSYALDHDYLALTVEGASGMDFEDYCKKHIFEPLGIDDMVWRREPRHTERLVDLCSWRAGVEGFTGGDNGGVLKPLCCSGGGGLYASATSYMKVLRTLLNDGISPDTGARIIGKDTIDLMLTPQVTQLELRDAVYKYCKDNIPFGAEKVGSCELGLGVKVMMEDLPGGRRAGSCFGEGYPKANIAYTIMTGIAPIAHPDVDEFRAKFERELYKSIA